MTRKQQQYLANRTAGLTPEEAAAQAGFKTPATACTRLEKIPEIREKLAQIEADLLAKGLYSREEAVKDLLDAVKAAKLKGDSMAVARCVAELNKMHGYYAPGKTETKHDVVFIQAQRQLEMADDSVLLAKIGGERGLVIEGETTKEPASGGTTTPV